MARFINWKGPWEGSFGLDFFGTFCIKPEHRENPDSIVGIGKHRENPDSIVGTGKRSKNTDSIVSSN
jgi:hypothetical protein